MKEDMLTEKISIMLNNVFSFCDANNSVNRLVKEIELLEVKNQDILYDVYLLQLRFEERHITKVSVEMDLDLVADLKNRLNIAKINNGGFNKELDKIVEYLISKRNWFMDQEKLKEVV